MSAQHPVRESVPIAEKIAVMEALHAAVRQRDELLAALRDVDAALCDWKRDQLEAYGLDVAADSARAAIAKATKE